MLKSSLLTSLLLLSASACVAGAPPGFSGGDLWTVPMVAPLESGQYLVPVSINGEGPFLFMVDPDSPESTIEGSIVASLKLPAARRTSPRAGQQKIAVSRQTEEDHLTRVALVEVKKMKLGTLNIRSMILRIQNDRTYYSGGRRVHGILGRDVIADSLIYSFNRDLGLMYIGTQGHLKTPPDAKAISFTQSYGNHRRYLAKLKINRTHNVTMHLDLGATHSMVWSELFPKFKLPAVPTGVELVDEYGTRRQVSRGGIAGIVGNKHVESTAIVMLPYGDKRLDHQDLDGIVGQNFWSKFNVTVNWHKKKFWLQDRNTDVAANAEARLGRWGNSLAQCRQPACISASLVVDNAPQSQAPGTVPADDPSITAPTETPTTTEPVEAPAAPDATIPGMAPQLTPAIMAPMPRDPQYSLQIERAEEGREFAYDVMLAAVDAAGKALALPTFLASFEAGVSKLSWPALSPAYAEAAQFIVIDMNPVGMRGCQGGQCVYKMPVRW